MTARSDGRTGGRSARRAENLLAEVADLSFFEDNSYRPMGPNFGFSARDTRFTESTHAVSGRIARANSTRVHVADATAPFPDPTHRSPAPTTDISGRSTRVPAESAGIAETPSLITVATDHVTDENDGVKSLTNACLTPPALVRARTVHLTLQDAGVAARTCLAALPHGASKEKDDGVTARRARVSVRADGFAEGNEHVSNATDAVTDQTIAGNSGAISVQGLARSMRLLTRVRSPGRETCRSGSLIPPSSARPALGSRRMGGWYEQKDP